MMGGALALGLMALLTACQTPPPASSNPPAAQAPVSEAAAAQAKPTQPAAPQPLLGAPTLPATHCVQRCVQASQMQARAIEAIEADCQRECARR